MKFLANPTRCEKVLLGTSRERSESEPKEPDLGICINLRETNGKGIDRAVNDV